MKAHNSKPPIKANLNRTVKKTKKCPLQQICSAHIPSPRREQPYVTDNSMDLSCNSIVLKEKSITISDEKFSSSLSKAYERGRREERAFKFYKHYGVCFSIASTLFISLLTSTFNDFWVFSSELLTTIASWVTAIFFLLGIVLVIWKASVRNNDEYIERDNAVRKMLDETINQEKQM